MSVTINSPLTTERDKYEATRFTNFINPVKEIEKDVELEMQRKPMNSEKVDSLRIVLNKVTAASKAGLENFRIDYVKRNTGSIFSLYLLNRSTR
jgi:hypothetical protein